MRYHFIGIQGSGMQGLSELVRLQGNVVTGSDLQDGGHHAANIEGADRVIYTPAVQPGSAGWVEIEAAQAVGIPTLRAEELLQELTRDAETVVAVAGTHGKSTTTAMVGQILEAAGRNPTVYIGAPVLQWDGRGYRSGDPSVWVVEADEYQRKLLSLSPSVAVITNIEFEHPDIYADLADVERTFQSFIEVVRPGGTLIACMESTSVQSVLRRVRRTDITVLAYGEGSKLYGVDALPTLVVPGRHNQLNALAALAVADVLGIDRSVSLATLATFQGASRRVELIGERSGVVVIDDYGHHPTELRASMQAVRERYPDRRLVVAFQPHQHARLRALFDDFAQAFEQADLVLITDVFAVPGRDEADEVDPRQLVAAIVQQGKACEYVGSLEDLSVKLDSLVRPGDVFMTIGATAITLVGRRWVAGDAA
ncbi:MAG: UDP-N-acetylmuramate--L-alanine ligase [Patescibacteria group bacterium]